MLRGAAFGLAGNAGSQLLRLASNLILARLLFPAGADTTVLALTVAPAATAETAPGRHRAATGSKPEELRL